MCCHYHNVSSGICGQRGPVSAQSDQGLHCPLTESMENKFPDETLHMRGMNLNLCILRMFEDTFSLGAVQMIVKIYI